jgi:hypothetical protein
VVSFTLRPLYSRGNNSKIGGWVGPRAGLDAVAKRKILGPHKVRNSLSCPCWESNLSRSGRSLVTIVAELPRLSRCTDLHCYKVSTAVYIRAKVVRWGSDLSTAHRWSHGVFWSPYWATRSENQRNGRAHDTSLTGWLIHWLKHSLGIWQNGILITNAVTNDSLAGWLAGWLAGRMTVNWLTWWLSYRLTDWATDQVSRNTGTRFNAANIEVLNWTRSWDSSIQLQIYFPNPHPLYDLPKPFFHSVLPPKIL